MIEVTVQNLKELKKEFDDFLGTEFILDLEKFKTEGLNQIEVIRIESKAHPLAIWWRAFKQDIQKSESSNSLQVSEYSLRILDLLDNLKIAKDIPNFKRIIDSIKRKNTFYSGVFEAYIAAGYCNMGFDVEAIEEKPEVGMKTCDLLVKTNEQNVYVECKSLDDPSIKESPLWNHLFKSLSTALEKYQRSWVVQIFACKQVDGKETDLILKEIIKDIKINEMSEKSILNDKFRVKYFKIAEWDELFTLPAEFPRVSEIGFIEAEIHGNLQLYRNLKVINVWPHTEFDIAKRLINEFKKAKKQIPKDGIGIVHIGIPYKDGSNQLLAVDNSYGLVYDEINRKTQRINAVAISSTVLGTIPQPINSHYYIVPNITTRNDLPAEFAILGTNESINGLEMDDEEGTIEFEFMIPKEYESQLPFYIFHYSSHDGKYQLQVWKTWSDKLRMDIFTPSIGRVFIETESIELKSDVFMSFAGSWGKGDVRVYLNGNRINLKKIH